MSSSTRSELGEGSAIVPGVESAQRADSGRSTSGSLIARVRANEVDAWERLVHLFAPLVYHWCRRARLQEHDTEDVFQEVFESVHAHVRKFRKEGPGDTFRGWLFTITRNKIRDHFRSRAREPRGEGGTDAHRRLAQVSAPEADARASGERRDANLEPLCVVDLDADSSADAWPEHDLVRRVLELIRSEFRETTWKAFWRTAIDERTAPEVAAELGLSPGAVRVAKSRVLRRVREELGDTI